MQPWRHPGNRTLDLQAQEHASQCQQVTPREETLVSRLNRILGVKWLEVSFNVTASKELGTISGGANLIFQSIKRLWNFPEMYMLCINQTVRENTLTIINVTSK
jgi:hypothetical protein